MVIRNSAKAEAAQIVLSLSLVCSACSSPNTERSKDPVFTDGSTPVFLILIYPESARANLEVDERGFQADLEALRVVQPEYTITEYDLTKANWIDRRFDVSVELSRQLGSSPIQLAFRAFVLSFEDEFLVGGVVHPTFSAAASRTRPVLHVSDVEADDNGYGHMRDYFDLWCVNPFWGGPHTPVSIPRLSPIEDARIGAYLARVVNGHAVSANESVKRCG